MFAFEMYMHACMCRYVPILKSFGTFAQVERLLSSVWDLQGTRQGIGEVPRRAGHPSNRPKTQKGA